MEQSSLNKKREDCDTKSRYKLYIFYIGVFLYKRINIKQVFLHKEIYMKQVFLHKEIYMK